jgi:putative ABC transport system permease protein
MFKNYFLSAYRNIVSDKFYSLINIVGLAIGIICTIFIILYIQDELTYDQHHVNNERIYRLESDFTIQNKHDKFAVSSFPLAKAIQTECPEIEKTVRFMQGDDDLFRYKNKEFMETNLLFADSTVFDVFTYPFIYGNPKTALVEQNSIVLSKKMAHKYFGDENPINEVIETGGRVNFKVTGVMEDLPNNSHIKFDALMSVETLVQLFGEDRANSMEPNAFWNISVHSFVLLYPNSEIQAIHDKFPAIYDKYMKSLGDQINASMDLMTTNLADLHFRNYIDGDFPQGNKAYIYIFIAVAIFILIIASINYMNLATARSAKRAREVGLRKVMGAQKKQLIFQFLSESILLTVISLLIAFGSIYILLPIFNGLSDKQIGLEMIAKPSLVLGVVTLALGIGIVSGIYPSFFLSSFIPIKVLKGKNKNSGSGNLRKFLVVFQFVIATIMIVGTIVVTSQLNYFKNKDLGFDKKDIVVLEIRDTTFIKNTQGFMQELEQNSNIIETSVSSSVPGRNIGIVVFRVEKEEKLVEHAINFFFADHNFHDLYNLKIKDGRYFDMNMSTDSTLAFVINEAAAKELGWSDNPIGKRIQFGFDLDGNVRRDGKVIGVVEDFNYGSLHNNIEPVVIMLPNFDPGTLSIKINGVNKEQALNHIQQEWENRNNQFPFEYQFIEEELDENYRAESKLGQIFSIFAIVSILISCLGLLGLSSFIAEQRTKEIGVRKVMGSSVMGVIKLLNKEFLLLVIISIIIACPLAYFAVKNWLENFAYRVDLQWTYFALAAVLTTFIAISITSIKTLLAARMNPADTLRYE